MSYVSLHNHTSAGSLLDGLCRISELPAFVKGLGMDSCAITDHGTMFGVIDFYKACKKAGVKPVIGCEVYTAARTRFDKEAAFDKSSGHLILLAETQEGYSNLVKIVSESYTDGFYYKPRVDHELLRKYSKGIICLSGCLAGKVQRLLLKGEYDEAKEEALALLGIFGEGNFFLEIQDHHLEEDKVVVPALKRLSKDINVPLVATNDAHYLRREDAKAQDVLMCIQTQTTVADANRMKFENDEFYLKSEEEMRESFADIPDAVDRTQEIADRCSVEFEFGNYHLPEYEPPEGYTCGQYLRALCDEGLRERYAGHEDEYRERLETELKVIEDMGFVEYFLIVWDFIHYAKTHGIPVGPGRGSAAGSIVSYCLGITELDPVKYGLVFERFLNPERVSMPDIDVDFCIERRQEVIDYVTEKYGRDKVSQIITFGTLKAKAAVRDVARALGASYQEGDAIAKAIPNELGITIQEALEVNPDLKARYDTEPQVKQIIDLSMALEGLPRHASTHAAGVVISKLPLEDYVPLYASDKGIATQFNMTTIEELGLLKMDFLGLRNLTVIADCLRMIKKNHGKDINFSKMEFDDPAVFRLIASGNTKGVFQLESRGMTDFMKQLKPNCFEDIIAGIALYRPGPMDSIPKYIENKQHPENITYVDPHLKPILDVTYGCLIYQEQVMQIVRDLGGYSYGRSDLVRRAMSKKKVQVMLEEKQYFINGKRDENGKVEIPGCIANGITEEAAKAIFDDMTSFASYAFNKSHAAAYAVISYETAYLKAHYPVEFMAALMSSTAGDADHTAEYVRNCREMGIPVDPPSVFKSEKRFTAENGRIRFGLLSIKNVGEGPAEAIIKARQNVPETDDFYQFIDAIEPSELNKRTIESLVHAGAFDDINPNRALLFSITEGAVKDAQKRAKKCNRATQISLYQLDELLDEKPPHPPLPSIEEYPKNTRLSLEKAMLGVYLSGHPLDEYEDVINANITASSSDFREMGEATENEEGFVTGNINRKDGDFVIMAGLVTSSKKILTKKGQEMARFALEDFTGVTNWVVFPKLYEKKRNLVEADMVVAVSGRISMKDESSVEFLAEDIVTMDNIDTIRRHGMPVKETKPKRGRAVIKLRITEETARKYGGLSETLSTLDEVFRLNPGENSVFIYMPDGKIVRLKAESRVNFSVDLKYELIKMLGRDNVKLEIPDAKSETQA